MSKFIKYFTFVLFGLFALPNTSRAEIAGLTKCGDSEAFQKRLTKSVKKLETRLKKYQDDTPPQLALQKQIAQTKSRFARYGESNLLCGNDGLPHLIADGRWSHSAEFILPGVLFLYITGWIGWVGRKYIRNVADASNPTEKEIIIDVPLALSIMSAGFFWPFAALQEYATGDLIASDDSVTTSPKW